MDPPQAVYRILVRSEDMIPFSAKSEQECFPRLSACMVVEEGCLFKNCDDNFKTKAVLINPTSTIIPCGNIYRDELPRKRTLTTCKGNTRGGGGE